MSAGCSGVVRLDFSVSFLFAVNLFVASDCVTSAAGTATPCPIRITINSVKTKPFILLLHEFFFMEFYISLAVHIGIILVNNQLDALSFNVLIYFTSLHVSSNPVLIIIFRRIELYQYIILYISLCVGDCLVCRFRGTYTPTHSDIYQMMY